MAWKAVFILQRRPRYVRKFAERSFSQKVPEFVHCIRLTVRGVPIVDLPEASASQ